MIENMCIYFFFLAFFLILNIFFNYIVQYKFFPLNLRNNINLKNFFDILYRMIVFNCSIVSHIQ